MMSDFICGVCHQALPYAHLSDLGCSCLVCHACSVAALERQLGPQSTDAAAHAPRTKSEAQHAQQQHCPLGAAACPICRATVPTALLRQLVPEALQHAEDALATGWLQQHSSIVRCPQPGCGAAIERLPASAGALGSSGVDGLSAEADAHLKAHRFRCPLCSLSFCDTCLASPYHQGHTCEQHAAPECPYCNTKVLPHSSTSTTTSTTSSSSSRHSSSRHSGSGVRSNRDHAVVEACQLSGRELRLAVERAGADASWCLERKELELLLDRVQQVCNARTCRQKLSQACTHQLACGHWCCGLRGEAACPPCLQPECLERTKSNTALTAVPTALGPDCCFCFEPLPTAPCILLTCRHACHAACAKARLQSGYPGPDISFSFLFCPFCGEGNGRHGNLQMATAVPHLEHPALGASLRRPLELRAQVVALAKKRLHLEGLARLELELQPGGRFDGRPADYAMRKFLFFECSKCTRPYFGGARGCGAAAAADAAGGAAAGHAGAGGVRNQRGGGGAGAAGVRGGGGGAGGGIAGGGGGGEGGGYDKSELLCGECSVLASGSSCPVHKDRYTEYKCRYCCSLASWFCWGSTHMCNRCHDDHNSHLRVQQRPCDPSTCAVPRGMPHPAYGEECCLGCGLCRRTAADVC